MKNFVLSAAYAVALCLPFAQSLPIRAEGPPSRGGDFISSVLFLSGASDLEELDSSELERFADYYHRPVNLNRIPSSRAVELLGTWRAASLRDYISRSGPVLSWTELSSVDGFSPEFVQAARSFATLGSGQAADRLTSKRRELVLRSSVRRDEGLQGQSAWALKYRAADENRGRLSLCAKNTYGTADGRPDDYSLCVSIYGRGKHFRELILGDYYARFGQGLALWNGFSLSGLGSVQAFSRQGGGISAAWTVSPSSAARGAAAAFGWGRTSLYPMLRFESGVASYAFAAEHTGSRSYAVLTLCGSDDHNSRMLKGSVCMRYSFGHLHFAGLDLGSADASGELALDALSGAAAAVGSFVLTPSYGRKIAILGRWYPALYDDRWAAAARTSSHCRDEAGVAAGVQSGRFQSTLDASRKISSGPWNYKSVTSGTVMIMDSLLSLRPRLSIRCRPSEGYVWRVDARLDATCESGRWLLTARANAVWCREVSRLYYIEGGYKTAAVSACLRLSAFAADWWDDRIYCYERDVPGCFNVPALYGRAMMASCSGTVRFAAASSFARHRLCWRLAALHYTAGPMAADGAGRRQKPDRMEARLQYMLDF